MQIIQNQIDVNKTFETEIIKKYRVMMCRQSHILGMNWGSETARKHLLSEGFHYLKSICDLITLWI